MAFSRSCRSCGDDADSSEHVFTSAIGGRLEFDGIVCEPCNNTFGATIDASLNESFRIFCLMLAIKGKKGFPPNMLITDRSGRKVLVGPGLLPSEGGGPTVVDTVTETGTINTTIRGQERQLREVVAARKRRDGSTVTVHSAAHHYEFPDVMDIGFQFDTGLFVRSATKTALVFAEKRCPEVSHVLKVAWNFVCGCFEAHEPDFTVQFTAAACPWVPDLGDVPHILLLDADAEKGQVLFDVRFFGGFGVRIRVRGITSVTARYGYAIDPLTGRAEQVQSWMGNIEPDQVASEALRANWESTVAVILRLWREVERRLIAERVLDEAVKEAGPDPDLRDVARRASEKVQIILARQTTERSDPRLEARLKNKLNVKKDDNK